METSVTHDAAAGRYDIALDGRNIGHASYRPAGDAVRIVHTEIARQYEGRGLAGVLAKSMLDDLRKRQIAVIPVCSYIVTYIRRHPEYADLVPEDVRKSLGLG